MIRTNKPRLVINRTNKYFYIQLIQNGKTLASVSKMTDAVAAGAQVAEKALKLKVKEVVFDRNGYRYHGNIKKLADSAREKGLVF